MSFDEIQVCTYRGILIMPSRWKLLNINFRSQHIQQLEISESNPGLLRVVWLLVVSRYLGRRDINTK
jgi:hypothetical protein